MSKFNKMIKSGLLKGPKNPTPDPSIPNTPKPIKTPMSKFVGLKRQLAKDKNNMKKYKI